MCNQCHRKLPIDYFISKNGREIKICMRCQEQQREYRIKNKEKLSLQSKLYREKNKERIAEVQKK